MAFLEAQAMRVPVASFAHGPLGEAVLDGQSGLLVPEGDISALTRALDRLLSESDTRGRFGDAGHSHVMARFDLVENSALLEQHYEEAVATWMRKGPPVPRS